MVVIFLNKMFEVILYIMKTDNYLNKIIKSALNSNHLLILKYYLNIKNNYNN